MPACSAYGCTNRPSKKIPGLTFHRFPKNEYQRMQWILAVRRKNWLPSFCSVLCSKHFPEDMIDRTSLATVRLRENAIPKIFDNFTACQKQMPTKHPRLEKNAVPSENLPVSSVKSIKKELKTILNIDKETMQISCGVEHCKSQFESNSDIVFHKFPVENINLTRRWIESIGQEFFTPSENHVVCSKHFTVDDYINAHVDTNHLKSSAVPSIFNSPPDEQQQMKSVKKQNIEVLKETTSNYAKEFIEDSFDIKSEYEIPLDVSNSTLDNSIEMSSNASMLLEENELQISEALNIEKNTDSEEETEDFFDIESLSFEEVKQKLKNMTACYKSTHKKLKLCQQRCNLYQKEVGALREIIDSLKQINSITDDS